MPSPYEAKSLRLLRDTLNRRWPNRDKTSDGWIGDTAHQGTNSDHNPDPPTMVVRARDTDKDGIVIPVVVASMMLHPSMRYVIFNRRIYRSADRWRPRSYTGSNPHTGHIHGSIHHTVGAENSVIPYVLIDGFTWPELRLGNSGVNVRQLQALLNAQGASLVLDSAFGPATDAAVRAFQNRRGLEVDGLVGRRTQAALPASSSLEIH